MAATQTKAVPWGRIRVPATWVALAFLVANAFLELVPAWLAIAAFVAAMAVYVRVGMPPPRGPVPVEPPVRGRWRALNTPADRVPSHGLNAYGQTFAIDLVAEPIDGSRPPTRWWPLGMPPERFPGFGEEVFAPGGGTVVRAHDGTRDHWSRNSWPGFALLLVEGGLRELTGPSRILGNHVVIDLGRGVYAVLAHLRRGSVSVGPGDAVSAGEAVGRCGNSGASSEPHLHFQLMDHPRVAFADGIPFSFEFELSGKAASGAPSGEAAFVA